MKKIKFRGWDKKNKKWINNSSNVLCVGEDVVVMVKYAPDGHGGYSPVKHTLLTNPEIDNLEIERYTGLKDKNGKEVYEGDIVRLWNGNISFISHNGFQFCVGRKQRPIEELEIEEME